MGRGETTSRVETDEKAIAARRTDGEGADVPLPSSVTVPATSGARGLGDGPRTRERILAVALDLFTQQGYAGTSIADIAARLGTSKAALYYHFDSKVEILDALVVEPLSAYAQLAERAATERMAAPELLATLIDMMADSRVLSGVIGNDPSVLSVLQQRPQCPCPKEGMNTIIGVLAGGAAGTTALIRATAAFAVAKETTLAIMGQGKGSLDRRTRAEILAAAMRALEP
ncbi:TetR/AcrR family transcriptional regulator [Frankia sp. QA3]|uniref:TetR/AcrR family transcriptional regulator n=1 Tax=Frankia sp. QA3 TaxID=710111 RepID=UPI000269CEB0|nr:TetR/AcrR family transcriptional regulator [Frankia sp. QA3]EIV96239.1 transcriptional regulator [Frankia sp. QA3]